MLSVAPRGTATLTFVFAGSATSEQRRVESFSSHRAKHHERLLEKKQTHYAALLDRARIRIPDRRLQQVYDWVRVNAQWLVRDVPGIGRGARRRSAWSIPGGSAPRPTPSRRSSRG